MNFSSTQKAYLAGFLDGDGSIYVRLKPNDDFRYGFQIAPYVVFFQSSKDRENFEKICALIGIGYLRERNDGMLEYVIQKQQAIKEFLSDVSPYLLLKRGQADLMLEILEKKAEISSKEDFIALAKLIDQFRDLNYSKKRKIHVLTP
jgi:intein-encoded DNA endonuclease-like protein